MNSTQAAVDNIDLEKLNDQDKAELRQFLNNQQQRSQIQSRASSLTLRSLRSTPFPLVIFNQC